MGANHRSGDAKDSMKDLRRHLNTPEAQAMRRRERLEQRTEAAYRAAEEEAARLKRLAELGVKVVKPAPRAASGPSS